MDLKKYFKSVAKGTTGTLVFTLVGVAVLSFVMTKFVFSKAAFNMIYVIISLLSLVFGSVVAARKNECRGLMVGIGVGIGYYLLISLFTIILGGKVTMNAFGILKLFITLIIAGLGGVLGINMLK